MAVQVPLGARDEGPDDASGPVAFEELWAHRETLRRFCERLVGDAGADDLVQETFLRALDQLDTLERRESLMPWLATVARRRGIDEIRRRRHVTLSEDLPEAVSNTDTDPGDRVLSGDALAKVQRAMSALSPRERKLLTAQVTQGLSLAELAAEDGTSIHSVRSVLNRARGKLRSAVRELRLPAFLPLGTVLARSRARLVAWHARAHQTLHASAPNALRLGELVTVAVAGVALATPSATVASTPLRAPAATGTPVAAATTAAPSAAGGTAAALPSSAPAEPVHAAGHEQDGERLSGPLPLDPLLHGTDVRQPEDAWFSSLVVPAGSPIGTTVLAAGINRKGCVGLCVVLFRSVDAGATWERLAGRGLVNAGILLVAPAYPSDPRVFALDGRGMQVSRDGGASFAALPLQLGTDSAAMAPGFSDRDQRILLGSTPPWSYDDATGTATPLTAVTAGGWARWFAFAPDGENGGLLLAGTATRAGGTIQAAVVRCQRTVAREVCTDEVVLPGLPDAPRVAVSSSFAADHTVYAWGGESLFRSQDEGRTFSPVPLPPGLEVHALSDDGAGRVYAAVSHNSEAGTSGGILRSGDGGRTWDLVGPNTPLAGGVGGVVTLRGGRVIATPLGAAGGGVLCSEDGGTTWARRCG